MATALSPQGAAYTGPSDIPAGAGVQAARGGRLVSLDVIRGAVMVLMAIDHVRVYSGQPPGGPTPGIFLHGG